MDWLATVPQVVVAAHMTMLPRLMAEESQMSATEGAVARTVKPGHWARRQWARWASAAREHRPASRVATPMVLRSIGIGCRVQQKKVQHG